ncbi:MAG: ferrous iron transport protein A [Promethearchaeota archaeon]
MELRHKRHARIHHHSTSLIKCLTECQRGEEVIVLNVETGMRQKQRLANLGIIPGAKIQKKSDAPFRGPLQIIVKGSSLVIGRGLASKIRVKCIDFCSD